MARMWDDVEDLAKWSAAEIVATITSAQECQKHYSMNHSLNPLWSRAINEGCAEMSRRVRSGDEEAKAVRL